MLTNISPCVEVNFRLEISLKVLSSKRYLCKCSFEFLHDHVIKMKGAKASCTAVGQLPKLTGQRGSKPYFGVAFGEGGGQAAAGEPGSLGVSGGWGGAGGGGRGGGGWGSAGAENVESFPGKISFE